MKGIYCYIDTKDDEVVYVGRDSHIQQKARHKFHINKKNYNRQQINKVIQNNPHRYDYIELAKGNFTEDELNRLEISFIEMYNTYNDEHKFNYTVGGDGNLGRKLSEDHIQILRKRNTGNTYALGTKHTDEWKKQASEWRKGENNPNYNKKFDLNHRLKLSKNNKTGIYRVFKFKDKRTKKGYRWCYKYYDDGKYHSLYSNSISKLKDKVIKNNLEWIILDEKKYNEIIKKENEYNGDL